MKEETTQSPTKTLFDCLRTLYQQGQQLLLDADRFMGKRGWESRISAATAEFSSSINLPERWFARWAVRFYTPVADLEPQGAEAKIGYMLFVGINFASDEDTKVNEPLLTAGRLIFDSPLSREEAYRSWNGSYWLCRSWFWGVPKGEISEWRNWDPSKFIPQSHSVRSFAIPLYDIKSSGVLEQRVIDKLIAGPPA